MKLKARSTPNAGIDSTQKGWKLKIPAGDALHYRFAQLDDYSQLPRPKFPNQSARLTLRARASHGDIPGTWGFGLWNDPQSFSLGLGGAPFRLPALPNAIWFFHASEDNYLSFTHSKAANGFLAQVFRAPRFHPLLVPAGLTLPFSRRATRNMLARVIDEDAISLKVDTTEWHAYKLEWSRSRSAFWVDDVLMLESAVSPRAPLGLVIWIDNQYAAFTPDGKIRFGVLRTPEPAWLEIEDLVLGQDPGQNHTTDL